MIRIILIALALAVPAQAATEYTCRAYGRPALKKPVNPGHTTEYVCRAPGRER